MRLYPFEKLSQYSVLSRGKLRVMLKIVSVIVSVSVSVSVNLNSFEGDEAYFLSPHPFHQILSRNLASQFLRSGDLTSIFPILLCSSV
jgi:hypothetical protein